MTFPDSWRLVGLTKAYGGGLKMRFQTNGRHLQGGAEMAFLKDPDGRGAIHMRYMQGKGCLPVDLNKPVAMPKSSRSILPGD